MKAFGKGKHGPDAGNIMSVGLINKVGQNLPY
jgi:hypothetical protein